MVQLDLRQKCLGAIDPQPEQQFSAFTPPNNASGSSQISGHETTASSDLQDVEPSNTVLSKNAIKKQRAQERLQEFKERRRALRPDIKRRKKAERREMAAQKSSSAADNSPPAGGDAGLTVRICVDCAFEELQNESEISSLVQQLMYAYGDANRLNRIRDKAAGNKRRWKSGWRGAADVKEDFQQTGKESTKQDTKEQVDGKGNEAAMNISTEDMNSTSASVFSAGDSTDQNVAAMPLFEVSGISSSSDSPASSASTRDTAFYGNDLASPPPPVAGSCAPPCFPSNRPAVELCISGVGPRVYSALRRVQCNGRWKCEVSCETFERLFAADCALERVVYLTADAEEELHTLDADTVYIVGGLVDRNRYKGLTLNRSKEKGVRAAKLPIETKLGRKLDGSKILTVNQVVGILIAYAELGEWGSALSRVLPARKSGVESPQQKESPLEENILLEN
ncbi:tRNA methyltransferase 10 homolog B [Cyclospora cayetanensis]|uniref:tRNA (guanine(9)-N(1))-methyltransferase n=1 Tax=Cyclospora cayetanensis TaxID=88456 RepID=A0A6P5WCL6_9EIME|nr:tRNA methyltransferase 10 homolog B [Cyclospora cayetanensis]